MRFDPQSNRISRDDSAVNLDTLHSVSSPSRRALMIAIGAMVIGFAGWTWLKTSPSTAAAADIELADDDLEVLGASQFVTLADTPAEASVTVSPEEPASPAAPDPHAEAREPYEHGRALVAMGRYQEAVPHFVEAIRRDYQFSEAHYSLALAYVRTGNRTGARKELAILTRQSPSLASLLKNLVH